jgi:hypothetical protein
MDEQDDAMDVWTEPTMLLEKYGGIPTAGSFGLRPLFRDKPHTLTNHSDHHHPRSSIDSHPGV